MKTEMTTLCYLKRGESYLMLHRISKKNDINRDKWIGVGGHFGPGESPEECLIREVKEETGYTLNSWQYRGIVTFISGSSVTEYMSLFTSDDFGNDNSCGQVLSGENCNSDNATRRFDRTSPEPCNFNCDEGKLEWVRIKDVPKLNLWPGDRIFLRLLEETDVRGVKDVRDVAGAGSDFFSLKLVYDEQGELQQAMLNGKELQTQ